MKELTLTLLNHPVLFTITMFSSITLVGLTYEFILKILKICAGIGLDEPENHCPNKDDNEPPEFINVPKTPDDPDGKLEDANDIPTGAEEIDNGDGTITVEYTYDVKPEAKDQYIGVPKEYMDTYGDPDDHRPWWAKDLETEQRLSRDIIKERLEKKGE